MIEKFEPIWLFKMDVRLRLALELIQRVHKHYQGGVFSQAFVAIEDNTFASWSNFALFLLLPVFMLEYSLTYLHPYLYPGVAAFMLLVIAVAIWIPRIAYRDFTSFPFHDKPNNDQRYIRAIRVAGDPRQVVIWELNGFIQDWNQSLHRVKQLMEAIEGGLVSSPLGELQINSFAHMPDYIDNVVHGALSDSLKQFPYGTIMHYDDLELTEVCNMYAAPLRNGRIALNEFLEAHEQFLQNETVH